MVVAACQILFFLVAFFLHSGAEAQSSGDLRLVGRNGATSSSLTAGRLEVYYNGQWGTVCDDLFSASEATVACRQLGFSDYVNYGTISTSFRFQTGSSSTPIWLDNLSCSFSNTRLDDCSHNTIGSTNCDHFEDVYVSCLGNGALRIGSLDLSSGRLEVYFNGQWGTVCNDFFFQTEANVACRQVGYSSATNYGTALSLGYSSGSGRIWLDNVDCSSSDIMLSSCSHNGIGNNNCFHSQDVAVTCSTDITDIISNLSTGIIIAIVVAVVVPFLCVGVCILIVCIAVCTGACAAGASSRRRNVTTTATTAAPPTATAVVTTSNTAQQARAQAPYSPYGGYQPAPAAYPAKGQPYPAQGGAPPYPTNTAPGYAPPGATQGKPPVELDQYAAYPPPTVP